MQLFYTPDIILPLHTLDQQQSGHAVKVLRLGQGDEIFLTDGRGNLHTARITQANDKRCVVEVVSSCEGYGKRNYSLTMAVAPTKNNDRYEWFLEKATEVGCDRFIPIESFHSERRVFKPERAVKVITSAVKQSLKAYHPVLDPLTPLRSVITTPFNGVKLIAHCVADIEREFLSDCIAKNDDVLILIGPEGDFSCEEINLALANGFRSITLGDARLRTETAALAAVMFTSFVNQ